MAGPWRDSPAWIEGAVASAARRLEASDPLAHVFYEERVDTRIATSSDGGTEATARAARGAAIVARTTHHVADPGPSDLERHAREAAAGAGPSDAVAPSGGWTLEPEAVLPRALEEWLAGSRSRFAGKDVRVEAALVESIQKIWVGRPGAPVASDLRRSRRLEVTARAGPARSVEERVLAPGEALPADAVARAVERALEVRSAPAPRGGLEEGCTEVAAVLAPGPAGIVVHELIGHALEADAIAAGRSRLWAADLRLPASLRVVDDPRRGRSPWSIDDEGTPSSAVTLIEGGRVAGSLRDRASALTIGEPSSGHGRRASYLERILPRMGCTYVDAGTSDPGSIVDRTSRGVYVRRVVAAEASPDTGRASFVVTDADIIDDGGRVPLLTPFAIVLDVVESIGSIDAIGNDLAFDRCVGSCVRDAQPMATSVGAPTIRLGVIRAFSLPSLWKGRS